MAGMTNPQAALIAAATQASRGNAMGIKPLLEKAGEMLEWLDAHDLAAAAGAYVPSHRPQEPREIKAPPVTVCNHEPHLLATPEGKEHGCLLPKGHAGVHRATIGRTKYEWSDHSKVIASTRPDSGAWHDKPWSEGGQGE